MGYSGYDRAVFIVMNKDNCELYSERVKFSKEDFAKIEQRARNIIYANEAPQKVETTSCDFCGYRQLCADGKYIQTDCSCGTCKHLQAQADNLKMVCVKYDHEVEAKHWGKCCSKWEYIYEDS